MASFPTLTRFERQILRSSERKDLFEDRFPHGSPHKRRSSSSSKASSSAANKSFSSDVQPGNDSVESSPSRPRDTHFYETSVLYNKVQIPIRIPVGLEQEDIGDYSIINLIQTFTSSTSHTFSPPFHPHLHVAGAQTPPILLLLNALLTGKRIVFLGSSVPARQVAQLVLAACSLASGGGSGFIPGFSERAFPYSNLINRDNHEAVPGYIAGVANPRFEAFTASWDVFCNIDTGKITVSKDIRMPAPLASPFPNASEDTLLSPASTHSDETDKSQSLQAAASLGVGSPPSSKHDPRESHDMLFIEEVRSPTPTFLESVMLRTAQIVAAVSARASEQYIRSRFAEYALRFLRLASKYEEEKLGIATIGWPTSPFSATHNRLGSGFVLSPESSRELQLHKPILDAWMNTRSYQLCKQVRFVLDFCSHADY